MDSWGFGAMTNECDTTEAERLCVSRRSLRNGRQLEVTKRRALLDVGDIAQDWDGAQTLRSSKHCNVAN